MIDVVSKQILATAHARGSKHDLALFKGNDPRLQPEVWIVADSGYQGLATCHRQTCLSRKKPRGGELSLEDKAHNQALGHFRIPDDMLDAILGLFNSTLANWWFVKRYGMLMEVGGFKIGKLPLPGTWEQSYEALVPLVQTLTESNAKLSKTRLSQDRKFVERQIKSTDRQINQLVYKLYELTPEEIALVEGGSVPRPGEGD